MSAHQWVFQKLTTHAPLLALIPAVRIVGSGSITTPPSARPFMMIRYLDSLVELRDDGKVRADKEIVQFWVYDGPGSYGKINDALRVIEDFLPGPVLDEPELIHVDWNGLGPESFDDVFKALARWGSATLVGSRS
jgi:hypothetical protein